MTEVHGLGMVSNHDARSEAKTNIFMSLIEVSKDTIPFADFYTVSLWDEVLLDDVTPKS